MWVIDCYLVQFSFLSTHSMCHITHKMGQRCVSCRSCPQGVQAHQKGCAVTVWHSSLSLTAKCGAQDLVFESYIVHSFRDRLLKQHIFECANSSLSMRLSTASKRWENVICNPCLQPNIRTSLFVKHLYGNLFKLGYIVQSQRTRACPGICSIASWITISRKSF